MSPSEEIRNLLERYTAAVRAKDVDALLALYGEDVRVFDMWERWSYDGAVEWRQMASEWFRSLGSEQVVVEFQDVHTVVGDDVAGCHAQLRYTALSAGGERLRAMDNRLTWLLRRTGDGAWKVVHEHTSAPVDMESSTVTLRR